MTKREAMEINHTFDRLAALGISYDDCDRLRRISMTLRRWFERECGDSNNYGSWVIERDEDGDGKPFLVHEHYHHDRTGANTTTTVTRTPIADRETGAKRRLAAIMAHYPTLTPYIQGDPRGCALYILTADQLAGGHPIDSIYNRGIAIG